VGARARIERLVTRAMVVKLDHVDGQTPPDPDELEGLKPKHITTQAELNAFEQLNILMGQKWALKNYMKQSLLTEGFVRDLHRRMFDRTWKWAGTFRRTDKSIGVPWEQISHRLDQLLKNTDYQIAETVFGPDELAARFHRDLVWIHPFPNGNGRHARMMADLLIISLGKERFTWGSADLVSAGEARTNYLNALRAGDKGDFGPLIKFARS
jgi:Fic-DOC domain mobile mystery protein B